MCIDEDGAPLRQFAGGTRCVASMRHGHPKTTTFVGALWGSA
jgi:hypothetical protein